MTCEVVRTHLSAFMDGALPGRTMAEVWTHINHCVSCHELYNALYTADEFYSSVHTQDVPQKYRDSLRARLRNALAHEASAMSQN
ncbi:MAG TPA: zf-HC2 domain-containing protein [Pyrinomonadaceae bacterium]